MVLNSTSLIAKREQHNLSYPNTTNFTVKMQIYWLK